jgi:ubiquinone/menaquinone biosynthesis C-methylase UbiE
MSNALSRMVDRFRAGGPRYGVLCVARSAVNRTRGRLELAAVALKSVTGRIEEGMLRIERSRRLAENWTVGATRFTTGDNTSWWDTHDWSKYGEEWTPNDEWKARMVELYLAPNVPQGAVALEIGPGGGRWSEVLAQRASRLILLDVASKPLDVCRKRFPGGRNIELLLGDGRTIPLPNHCVDAIWSYDVFVHVNPPDARSYVHEFSRVLRAGGRAVVHHPAGRADNAERAAHYRSNLTDEMFCQFAEESGLKVLRQASELVTFGEVVTVLAKPEPRP